MMLSSFLVGRLSNLYAMRVIFLPILLSIGILIYYSLPFEPTWFQLLFLFPALLIMHFIRAELGYFFGIILLGVCAFKARVIFVGYKPSQVTSATMIFQAKLTDIRQKQYDNHESWKILVENINHIPTGDQLNYTSSLPKKALLNVDKDLLGNAMVGNIVEFKARLMPIKMPLVPNAYDPRFFSFFENIGSAGEVIEPLQQVDSEKMPWRAYLKQLIKKRLGEQSDFVLATILGDKLAFKKEILDDFSKIGLGHVLAISGLHIGIIAVLGFFIGKVLFWLIGFYDHRSWSYMLLGAKIVSMLFVVGYLFLSGMGFSALRASMMFILGLLLFYTQRNSQLIFSLITASTIILLFFPESLFYASFQLSVLAVLAFCLIKYKKEQGFLDKGIAILKTTTIISLLTLPLLMYHFDQVALQPFLANLVLLPYITIVLIPASILWFLLQFLLPIDLLGWILGYMIMFLKYISGYMSMFAFTASTPIVKPVALIVYGLSIPFLATGVRVVSLAGIGFFIVSLLIPTKKPILLADNYGRIGFVKNDILYVSWDPNPDKFIEQVWKKYWNVDEVKRFNSKDTTLSKIREYRKTADVTWEMGGKKLAWCAKECEVNNVYIGFGNVRNAFNQFMFVNLAHGGGIGMYANGEIFKYQVIQDRPWLTKNDLLKPI